MGRCNRNPQPWYTPVLLPVAVFHCRRCQAELTRPLVLLTDVADLSDKAGTPRVPAGRYWPVGPGLDFAGQFAVSLADVIPVFYVPDRRRLSGCCGPSGDAGPNRLCACGREIGTEQSDCIYPHAVYLDPARCAPVAPVAGDGA